MKIIKYLLFIIIIIFIAGAIYVATIDGDYHLEETHIIDAPQKVVYDEVNELKNWEEWNILTYPETGTVLEHTEKTRGEEAGLIWKSDELDGSIMTIEAIPYSAINQELSFDPEAAERDEQSYWRFQETENGVEITWGIQGSRNFSEKLKYAFRSQSFSEVLRPKLSASLDEMDNVIHAKMETYSINVDGVTRHGGGYYMYTTTSSRQSRIQDRMWNMINDIRSYMQENNIDIIGSPFAVYSERDEENETAIFSAGLFTPNQVVTPNDSPILNNRLPEQRVVKTTLKGNYKNLQEAWDEAYRYIEENDLEVAEEGKAFEVYRTNPEEVANPANWITEIYIPIE